MKILRKNLSDIDIFYKYMIKGKPKRRSYINNIDSLELLDDIVFCDNNYNVSLSDRTSLDNIKNLKVYNLIKWSDTAGFPLPQKGMRQIMVMVKLRTGKRYCIPVECPETVTVTSKRYRRSEVIPVSNNLVTFETPDEREGEWNFYFSERKCTRGLKIIRY